MNNFLEFQNIELKYGKKPVVHNLSFKIDEFDCLGLIGPNGSGKSTILRSLGGSLKPSKGSIIYQSKDMRNYATNELSKERALVPQFIESPFPYSVKDFIAIGRFPHTGRLGAYNHNDEEIIADVMCRTDTLELASKSVLKLSGGERQRVILAQALVQKPRLLLLDEPFSHLDIAHQVNFAHLLKQLVSEKLCTVIIAMHDLTICSLLCNKVAMLDKGSLSSYGKPSEVCTHENLKKVFRSDFEIIQNSKKNGLIILPKINL